MIDQHSIEAYRAIIPKLSEREGQVLDALLAFPDGLTADQLAAHLGRMKSHVMPRLTGLKDLGFIEKIPRGGVTEFGKTCNLWRVIVVEPEQRLLF